MAVRANDLHRVFLQSLLARRAMPGDVALEMYRRAVSACMDNDSDFRPVHARNKQGLTDFLGEVGTLLENLGLTIKRGYDEQTGRPWVVLCNSEAGDVAQQATDLTSLEISYFRTVIEAIVGENPGYSIGSMAALNLVSGLQGKMTKTDAESLLESLVSRHWLLKSKRGRYSLAPRALLELDHYLREEYEGELILCGLCNRLMMTGVQCAHEGCGTGFHLYCFDRLRGPNGACVKCSTSFSREEPTPIGEQAVPRNEDDHRNVRRKRKRQSGVALGSDEEEDEDEDENAQSQSQSQSQRPTQSQCRRISAGSAVEEEEEAGPSRRRGQQETIIPDSIEDEEDEEEPAPRRASRRGRK